MTTMNGSCKVILTKGLPASGKTTWAKQFIKANPGWKRVNKDDLRAMIDDGKWSPENEKLIIRCRNELALIFIKQGYNLIIDDTNLNPIHEKNLKELLEGVAEVEVKDFTDVPLDVCVERDKNRLASVGYKVIRGMWYQYLAKATKRVEFKPGAPEAIICDLDGTLALFEGKRSPYDASNCEQDDLNVPIANILNTYREKDYRIIFVSGRKDRYEEPTRRYIENNLNITKADYDLFMRHTYLEKTDPIGNKYEDNRKDWIIKEEIWNRHLKDNYNILFVLDDRQQVVDGWRYLGLTCLQVADGNF